MITILFFWAQSVLAVQLNVPMVNLDFWNEGSAVRRNNCYNYATNRKTNTFAQPGEASGNIWKFLQCKDVYKAASSDLGLTPTEYFPYNGKQDYTLVALVVAPNYDFHWYRRGDDNMWTHKIGMSPAEAKDNRGNKISDIETADRGRYTDFCGYFRVKNFVYETNEQNGGQVRIGNMIDLPPEPEQSEIIVMKYSGRPNPTMPLRNYLQNNTLVKQLTSLRSALALASVQTDFQPFSKLGYTGILILDREGLIFEKGSSVQINGVNVSAHIGNSTTPVSMTLTRPLDFERAFAE